MSHYRWDKFRDALRHYLFGRRFDWLDLVLAWLIGAICAVAFILIISALAALGGKQ